MAINNIIVVGCNIVGLYSALRCADNGYRVSIVDKLSSDKVSGKNRNNYRVFNKSHHIYIHLLNRFSIKYDDPKAFDGTEVMNEKYAERSLQIASELYFVFSQIK